MSAALVVAITALFAGLLGCILFAFWHFIGRKQYVSLFKKKEIARAKELMYGAMKKKGDEIIGIHEELMVKWLIEDNITDSEVIRQAHEQIIKENGGNSNVTKKLQPKETG